MTAGFHPKPRMSFPLPLALGIVGEEEVAEVELAESLAPEEFLSRLRPHLPGGLVVTDARVVQGKKAGVRQVTYEMDVPGERVNALKEQITRLQSSDTWQVERKGKKPVDLRPLLVSAAVDEGKLRFALLTPREGGVRAREVLNALGVADLEQAGAPLVRTTVELEHL